MKKVPIIMVEKSKLLALSREVGRSQRAVYMALSFKTDGDIPNLIREKAIKEYGGVKTQKIVY